MFKRVAKRIKKKEREEELGLDDEAKEILGLHDTDSEESQSDSDPSSDEDGSEDEDSGVEEDTGMGRIGVKRMREESDADENDEEGDDVSDEEEQEESPISLSEALRDPVYTKSVDPPVQSCIVCSGKLLKNPRMTEVHRESKAHVRRFDRFRKLGESMPVERDVRDVLTLMEAGADLDETPSDAETGEQLSKRALKRKARQNVIKKKRETQKIMKAKALAKRTAKTDAEPQSDSDDAAKPPPSKKPKRGDNMPKAAKAKSAKKAKATSSDEPPPKKRRTRSRYSKTKPTPVPDNHSEEEALDEIMKRVYRTKKATTSATAVKKAPQAKKRPTQGKEKAGRRKLAG